MSIKLSKKHLIKLIKEEMYSLYSEPGEQESIFKEREMSHEISKCLDEISFFVDHAKSKAKYPTDMDTIEIRVGQLKNWQNTLKKFLMAIGG